MTPATFIGLSNMSYNLIQGGLTYLQANDLHWAKRIIEVREYTIVAEVALILFNQGFLFYQLDTQNKTPFLPTWLEERSTMTKVIVLTASAAALSALTVLGINYLTSPSIDLQEVFRNTVTNLNPDIKLSFSRPMGHVIYQAFIAHSIFLHLWSASLSKNPYLEIANAGIKLFSLFNLSKLHWVSLLINSSNYPLKDICNGSAAQIVQKLESKFYVLIPSKATCDLSYLQAVVKNIYNYSCQFFQNSTWDYHWLVMKQNGVETQRQLIFDVVSKADTGLLTSNHYPSLLTEVTGSAFATASYNFWGLTRSLTGWWSIKIKF